MTKLRNSKKGCESHPPTIHSTLDMAKGKAGVISGKPKVASGGRFDARESSHLSLLLSEGNFVASCTSTASSTTEDELEAESKAVVD